MGAQIRAMWSEPRSEPAPRRVWRDWALLAVLLAVTVLEVVFGDGQGWRAVTLTVGIVVALSLLWRRSHPLASAAVAFGTLAAVDIATIIATVDSPLPWTVGGVLLLPYALFR